MNNANTTFEEIIEVLEEFKANITHVDYKNHTIVTDILYIAYTDDKKSFSVSYNFRLFPDVASKITIKFCNICCNSKMHISFQECFTITNNNIILFGKEALEYMKVETQRKIFKESVKSINDYMFLINSGGFNC